MKDTVDENGKIELEDGKFIYTETIYDIKDFKFIGWYEGRELHRCKLDGLLVEFKDSKCYVYSV